MNLKKRFIAVILFITMLVTTCYSASPSVAKADMSIDNTVTFMEDSLFEKTARDYLQDKIDVIISNKDSREPEEFEDGSEKQLIASYRKKLASFGETYSDSKMTLEILERKRDNSGKVHIVAKEVTYLTIRGLGVDTGYSAEHEFIFEYVQNEWMLAEHRQLEPSGLLPLWQANKLVYDYSTATKSDETSNDETYDLFDRYGVSFNDISLCPPSSWVDDKPASRAYDYGAMCAYLEQYWKNYNPAYRSFHPTPGDCTNFVSQALYAGGWEMVSGWYQSATNWWYNAINQTYSWTGVEYLGQFAIQSGRVSLLNDPWDLRRGDFMQVKENGIKKHSMMVSYFYYGIPFFTYHSNNRYRRSLYQVLLDWEGATFILYRT